jgi:hypothetical protein
MKRFVVAIGLLRCMACSQTRSPEEGFEGNPKSGDSTVFISQGQSCISNFGQLALAIKYPTRLPKGVSVKAISNLEFMLTARSDALVGLGGSISDILSIVVSEPKATLTASCDTAYQPI